MTNTEKKISGDVVAGVDVGSLAAKSVIIADGEIIGHGLIPSGFNSEETGKSVLQHALNSAGVPREALKYIVATGYGRISADYANKTVTEISCHARGANFLYPAVRTIIDIGGQDCKAIRLDGGGNVVDFAMNDKCAAGTGRFLEVMSNVFKVKLEDLGDLALSADSIVPMSSTCTVFVESETISLIARGEKPANIQAGIHHAIANRISGLFSRVGIESDVFFSGGVAKNKGMRRAIAEVLKVNIVEPTFDPQLTGALGAAAIAWKNAVREGLCQAA
ncbi:MAG: acyl-CoA dehydratase activase [Candidatus Margulisbacteria bacterium]|jgi:predicted CoA-substrate-specific enzyme activase|nr:acyl-CoA dehydratase activase [Candidatus Margulisiibacteriota bacterium]